MKFLRLYILTFLVAREVASTREFSETDLHFIAQRLYPYECSKLLSYLPTGRKSNRGLTPVDENPKISWILDNSQARCFQSLSDLNERGRSTGFSRRWLETILYRFGRPDIIAGLRKRWKKPKTEKQTRRKKKKTNNINNKKSIKKSTRRGRKSVTSKKKENGGNKIVKSLRRQTDENLHKTSEIKNYLLDDRFIICVAIGTFVILGFLAIILIISYRRACQCYENYTRCVFKEEKRRTSSKGMETDFEEEKVEPRQSVTGTSTKVIFEPENIENEERRFSNDPRTSLSIEKSKAEPEIAKSCTCKSHEKKKRKLSPCAKIKRFIERQKRILRGEEDFAREKRKRPSEEKTRLIETDEEKKIPQAEERKCSIVEENELRRPARARRKSKKLASNRKRSNREKRAKALGEAKMTQRKPIGCTCEVCRLFEIKGNEKCSERSKNSRLRKS